MFDVSSGQVINVLQSLRRHVALPEDLVDGWREMFDT
jgi:hypothetical protein